MKNSTRSLNLVCLCRHMLSWFPLPHLWTILRVGIFPLTSMWSGLLSKTVTHTMKTSIQYHKILLYMFLILLRTSNVAGSYGLKVFEVKVPNAAIVGQPAKLDCDWDSGDKEFYAVRWYMNNEQFYSFIRNNSPGKVDHTVPGIHVDLDYSDQYSVTLSEVTLDSEGEYRCEVMSDAPNFQTAIESRNLTVVKLPSEPEIYGVRTRYRVGEMLNITCTVRDAYPEAKISFHLNDRKIHHDSGRIRKIPIIDTYYRTETHTSSSQLMIPLSKTHGPTLHIICRAHVRTEKVDKSIMVQVDPAPSIMSFGFFSNKGAAMNIPPYQAVTMVQIIIWISSKKLFC